MKIIHKLIQLISIILIAAFSLQDSTWGAPGQSLRPMAMRERDDIEPSVFPQIFTEYFTDRAPVFKNGEKQVTLRVCEISDLTDEERSAAIESFGDWPRKYTLHWDDAIIPDILPYLKDPDRFNKRYRVYLALSEPDINGKGKIGVEGFVEVVEKRRYTMVTCVEINPLNKPLLIEYRVKTASPVANEPVFIGAGQQLLAQAVKNEMEMAGDSMGLVFDITDRALEGTGLEPDRSYGFHELFAYLKRRNDETIELLIRYARQGDTGAPVLLRHLNIDIGAGSAPEAGALPPEQLRFAPEESVLRPLASGEGRPCFARASSFANASKVKSLTSEDRRSDGIK